MEPHALDLLCTNTLRFLAVDAIQKANSGHPGLPMGAAPMAYCLWTRFLRHNPADPAWPDRDRFVLSAGHGSMLLYGLLHLSGYDLTLEDIQQFRQWGSRTPGHPEAHRTPGVEATTGPLGQGLANAIGMAVAEAHLAARFNRSGHEVVNHRTYCLASDGDLMEGVASEACSLAGHLRLSKLTVLYDSNDITLAGGASLCFTEDVAARFRAYGWSVLKVDDGNDLDGIRAALTSAQTQSKRPALILVRTIIGFGAPHKQGTFGVHGAPLGADEVRAAKLNLGWPLEPAFLIPDEVCRRFREVIDDGSRLQAVWEERFRRYEAAYPDLAAELRRRLAGELPKDLAPGVDVGARVRLEPPWSRSLPCFAPDPGGMATRKASEAVLQSLAATLPELVGGSADLNPSTFTWLMGQGDFQAPETPTSNAQGAVGGVWNYAGRNLHFGIREHAMGAIANGMALHGGLIPYAATFCTFADYMRPPIRLAAMSRLHTIFVFTHDSIGVGEDGPTHQPVEQLMNLRGVPGLTVIRPADAAETVEAWRAAVLNSAGPTALVLTRQNLPMLDRARFASAAGLHKGAYTLWQSGDEPPEILLIGTGSEVQLVLAAGEQLANERVRVRVVSMPSWDIFDRQPPAYRESVLPHQVTARLAVEAGISLGWEHYVGLDGRVVGMEGYGASAPVGILYQKFGVTADHVLAEARSLLWPAGAAQR
jgi:transketolase